MSEEQFLVIELALIVDQSKSGQLFYATSPALPGLMVAELTEKEAIAAIPKALSEMMGVGSLNFKQGPDAMRIYTRSTDNYSWLED